MLLYFEIVLIFYRPYSLGLLGIEAHSRWAILRRPACSLQKKERRPEPTGPHASVALGGRMTGAQDEGGPDEREQQHILDRRNAALVVPEPREILF